MKSLLYEGEILHHRLEPVVHRFRYPLFFCGVELTQLEQESSWWLGYNRPGLLSLYDSDYLEISPDSLRVKIQRLLANHGHHEACHSVYLVTCARFLGYVFNPVSFYFCYDSGQHLRCVVAEVNNTFGERHAYILDQSPGNFPLHYRVPKAFYVSPFNGVEGDYDFQIADPQRELDIRLKVWQDGRTVFNSRMTGQARALTGSSVVTSLARHPVAAWKTLLRIHKEAAVLYFVKHLPLVSKPCPISPLRAVPSRPQRLSMGLVRSFLQATRRGRLTLELPDGQQWRFGEGGGEAKLRILSYDFFPRVLLDGDIALGDAYVAGQIESPDWTAVIGYFLANRELLKEGRLTPARWLGKTWHSLRQRFRANTLQGSRRNIRAHYDLGNRLYAGFLDSTMSYSCAVYGPGDDLEAAQRNKMRMILEKARLEPGMRLLEIGCGWGSLAIEAAKTHGCLVTGITLSQEQLEWGRRRVAEEGLSSQIRLELLDYRNLQGSFERIISVEMVEAVGHENLGLYFQTMERVLAPDGLVVIQAITVPDYDYHQYRRGCDWIQKEIFPGGVAPCLSALTQAMQKSSRLQIEELENIGPHYARTLRDWRHRFQQSWPELQGQGYDEKFRRTWEYYLAYCEAGFAHRNLADLQLVLTRPGNPSLIRRDPRWL